MARREVYLPPPADHRLSKVATAYQVKKVTKSEEQRVRVKWKEVSPDNECPVQGDRRTRLGPEGREKPTFPGVRLDESLLNDTEDPETRKTFGRRRAIGTQPAPSSLRRKRQKLEEAAHIRALLPKTSAIGNSILRVEILEDKSNGLRKAKQAGDMPVKSIEKEETNQPIAKQDKKIAMDEASMYTFRGRFKRHFSYHSDKSEYAKIDYIKEEKLRCHWCQIRKFSTHAKYPIAITNDVDEAHLPRNFKFIEASVLGEGVEAADDDFRTGCECKNDSDCKFMGCQCLQDMVGTDADEHGKIFSYHSSGPRKDCLRAAKLDSRDPIYECHRSCACSENCSNRVVERGRKIPLNIFRTDDGRGWGVRSSVPINKGQFIDRYLGEIITSRQANKRRKASNVAQRKDVYLFALDKFSDPDSMDPRLSGPAYEADGEFYASPTRFINHSCEPNLRSFARVGDHADKHIHDLAFFAMENIPANTELTFDYVDGEDTLMEDSHDPAKVRDMTKCLCGSTKCRGYLW